MLNFQVKKVEQALEQIRQEKLVQKIKKIKNQGEELNVDEQTEKVCQPSAERTNQENNSPVLMSY
jgi:hypothetical protein